MRGGRLLRAAICVAILVVIGLVVAATSVCVAQAPSSNVTAVKSEAFGRGLRLFRAQNWSGATTEFEQACRESPEDPRPHYQLGLCYARLNRFSEAMEQLQTARNLDPGYQILPRQEFESSLASLQKDWDKARQTERQSALQQGEKALGEGDPITALSHLYDAQRLEPRNARVRYVTGVAYLTLGWSKQAVGAFEKARELEPKLSFAPKAEWDEKLAEARRGAQYLGPAQEDIKRATQLREEAGKQLAGGEAEAALSSLQLARSLNPEDPAVYYALALCYVALERYDPARAALDAAKELDPKIRFANRAEFERVAKEINAKASSGVRWTPAPSLPPTPPTAKPRTLDFADALKTLRPAAALVADLSLRARLSTSDLMALQQMVEECRSQGVQVRFAVIDREMKLTAPVFAERMAGELGLAHGQVLIVADESGLAAVSGDLPASEIASLVNSARAAFRQDRVLALLQLAQGLAKKVEEVTARRRLVGRIAVAATLVATVGLVTVWTRRRSLRRRSRERLELHARWLAGEVQRQLEGRDPEAVPKATLDRWWQAQRLVAAAEGQPAEWRVREEHLREAAGLLEECLRELG